MKGEVRFEAVSKRYGPVTAVDRIDFVITPGTLVTLLGPSGCGKTTSLRMIAGLELPSGGRITLGGREVTGTPASERDVGMVFQSYALFPHLDVLQNVIYGLLSRRRPRPEAEAAARRTLSLVGLEGFEGRLPSELSGGQQQRVALARALVLEPEVLLFDEPLSNLDARLRRRMREEIRQLQRRLGITAVYVTHDRDEALSISDRVIVMEGGRIVQQGPPEEIYRQPASLFVARFMGEANVLEAELVRGEGELGTVRSAGIELALPHRDLPAGPVTLVLRPEALALHPAGGPAIEGEVISSSYLGDRVEYTLRTAAGEILVVDRKGEAAVAPGSRVRAGVEPWGAVLLPRS